MHKIKKQVRLAIKNIRNIRQRQAIPDQYIHDNVPYYSQWESRELVEQIITRKIDGKDDPKWRESGAESREEYDEWSRNGCGMACLKMILASAQNKTIPLATLGKMSLRYGVYRLPLYSSPGMFYKPFVNFIKKEFGLIGKADPALTIHDIKGALSKGGYVIASVTPEIRYADKQPSKKGGHLILVYGYNDREKVLFLHNPSGFLGTQNEVQMSESMYKQYFDNKGILVFGE